MAAASDVFWKILSVILGFWVDDEFIGEGATRDGAVGHQVGPRSGKGVGRTWGAFRGWEPPPRASSWLWTCSFVKIIHVNFQLIQRNFPEQIF